MLNEYLNEKNDEKKCENRNKLTKMKKTKKQKKTFDKLISFFQYYKSNN